MAVGRQERRQMRHSWSKIHQENGDGSQDARLQICQFFVVHCCTVLFEKIMKKKNQTFLNYFHFSQATQGTLDVSLSCRGTLRLLGEDYLSSCASSQQGAATCSILQHIHSIHLLGLDMARHAPTYCHTGQSADT
jgi:hypothetical protein